MAASICTFNVPSGHQELNHIQVSLPAGLLARINGMPTCSAAQAAANACPAATQIGGVSALAGQGASPGSFTGSVYLADAPSSSDLVGLAISLPVQVGPINLGFVNVMADVRLRSDYGIDVIADVWFLQCCLCRFPHT